MKRFLESFLENLKDKQSKGFNTTYIIWQITLIFDFQKEKTISRNLKWNSLS